MTSLTSTLRTGLKRPYDARSAAKRQMSGRANLQTRPVGKRLLLAQLSGPTALKGPISINENALDPASDGLDRIITTRVTCEFGAHDPWQERDRSGSIQFGRSLLDRGGVGNLTHVKVLRRLRGSTPV